MKKNNTITSNNGQYWPLLNQKGLKGFLTPFFAGHLAVDHDHYILEPASEHTLYQGITPRNLHIWIDGVRFDINGLLPHQIDTSFEYETGHTYQKVTRHFDGVEVSVLSFLALHDDVEIHDILIKNVSNTVKSVELMSAVSIYGRSAENQRDHRHVTSLLNETFLTDHGVITVPRLHFDESGHHKNTRNYFVSFHVNAPLDGIVATLDNYVNKGSYVYPKGFNNYTKVDVVKGYEAFGGIHYKPIHLKPNDSVKGSLLIGTSLDVLEAKTIIQTYHNHTRIQQAFQETKVYYDYFNEHLSFKIANEDITRRLKDVVLQPVYRRYMGNSYLPHHDYGKGGRGWRDLWQDMIALNMYNDPSIVHNMYQYFKGVRLDGTNATIIGEKPGEFKADRNQITRVWSDHGAWPLITVKMYLDETGDLSLLTKKQAYFNDHLSHYGQQLKAKKPSNMFTTYEGTILEHLLVQHITAIFHTGDKGFIKLLDADWNDGLDMGKKQAETIAFTMMYTHHIKLLSQLIQALEDTSFTLMTPLVQLLSQSISLQQYFDAVLGDFNTSTITKSELVTILDAIYTKQKTYLQNHAFDHNTFQSYVGHDGQWLDTKDTVMLTGQAMALLNHIATEEQAALLKDATKKHLFKKGLGGYQLNSLYELDKHPLGRAFYFAYGHKENGAVFSHMAMMYIYGLYNYGFIDEAKEGYMAILEQSLNPNNQVYRGIPEYFNDLGHGKYLYLTGSASWLLYILRRQVFGLHFELGKLYLNPKLHPTDFISGKAIIETIVFNQKVSITYVLKDSKQKGYTRIQTILADGQPITLPITKAYKTIEVTLE